MAKLLSLAVDRPRPFAAHPGTIHALVAHAADAGFPSDHATAAFAIATTILLAARRWGLLVLLAAAILALGRVALGVHYPSDVLAGAGLGAAAALALHRPLVAGRLDAVADAVGRPLDRALRRRQRRPTSAGPVGS